MAKEDRRGIDEIQDEGYSILSTFYCRFLPMFPLLSLFLWSHDMKNEAEAGRREIIIYLPLISPLPV